MKDNDLKEKLYRLFDEQVPDEFAEILSKSKIEERNYRMDKKTNKLGWFWKLAFTFTVFIVLAGGLYTYQRNYLVDSIIELDVNPSIELQVNKKEKIVKYKALKKDAEEILQDMELKGVDIDVALNAIIGSMVTKGYLDDLANSILISVDNDNPQKAEELRQKLATKINTILSGDKLEGSVLSQTISGQKTEAEKLAKKYDISLGKAEFILDILNNNPLLKEEDLVHLSIHEINVLTQGKENSLTTVSKQGTASTKAYIGEEKAKEIALNHAGMKEPAYIEVEFDTENGIILYEVEFKDATNEYEYEYEINAVDGSIISSKKEKEDDYSSNSHYENNSNFISSSKAKEIALNHAGVKSPTNLTVELDQEDKEYKVEFYNNGYEYEYEINATNGNIISSDREKEDHHSSSSNLENNSNFISSSKAKEIALNHAGVKSPTNLTVELDEEDKEYKVEFYNNGYEYEYEINATNGNIISSEKEKDNH